MHLERILSRAIGRKDFLMSEIQTAAQEHRTVPNAGPEVVTNLANVAFSEELLLVETELPESPLLPHQQEALEFISMGHTVKQTTRHSKGSKGYMNKVLEEVQTVLGVPNEAAAVNQGIQDGWLHVDSLPDPVVLENVGNTDRKVLQLYAAGGNNMHIAKSSNQNVRAVNKYEQDLFKKIKAWSRPHAVRRAYELGILERVQTR
jgi:DNA-binding NarL/FixJ family response regulator